MSAPRTNGYLTLLGELIDTGGISLQEAGWIHDIWVDFTQALDAEVPDRIRFMHVVKTRLRKIAPRHNSRKQLMNGAVGRVFRDCVYRLCLLQQPKDHRAQYIDFLRYCPQRPIADVFIQSDETQAMFGDRCGLAPDEMSRLVRSVVDGASKKNIGSEKLREAFRRLQIVPSLQPVYELPQVSFVIGKHEIASPFVNATGGFTSREQGLLELAAAINETNLSGPSVDNLVQGIFGISDRMKIRARSEWICNTLGKPLLDQHSPFISSILAAVQLAVVLKPTDKVTGTDTKIAELKVLGMTVCHQDPIVLHATELGIWDCDVLAWAKASGISDRHGIQIQFLESPAGKKTLQNAIDSFESSSGYCAMTLPRSALPEYLVAKADDVAITNVFDGFNLICNPNLVSADAEETQSHDSNCKKSLPKFDPFEAAQFAVEIVLFAHAFNLQVLCHDDAGLTFWKSLCKFAVSKIKQDSGKPPAYARNLPSLAIHKYQSSAEDLAKMVADNPKCIAVCTGPTLYFAKIFGLIECFNFRQFYRALPDDQRDTFAGVPIHTSVNVLAPENVGDDELAAFQKRIQGLAFDLTEQIAKSPQAFIEFIANEMNMDCANLSWIEEAFKASYQYKSPRSYASTWYSGNRPYSVKRSREHHLSPEEQSNIRDELQQLDNAARTKLSLQKRAVAPEFDSGNGPEAQFDQDVARVFTRSQAHYHNYSNACDEFECLMEQLTERIHWIASNGTNPLVEQDLKYLAELAELMHKHFLTAQAVHILQMVFSASNWKAPTDKANLKNTQSRCISEHSNGE